MYVETEAALQTFKRGEELHINKAFFEGGSTNVVLLLQGLEAFEDLLRADPLSSPATFGC